MQLVFPFFTPVTAHCFFTAEKRKPRSASFSRLSVVFPIFLRLVHRPGDVRPVIFVGKGDLLHCLICVFSGFLHSGSVGSHAQYPAAVGDDLALAVELRTGVEYIVILFVPELLQAVDHKSLLIRNGISVGGQDHADGGPVVIEFQIDLVQGPVNAGLKYIHNVVFQSGQHHPRAL